MSKNHKSGGEVGDGDNRQPRGSVWLHGRVYEQTPRFDISYDLSKGTSNGEFVAVLVAAMADHFFKHPSDELSDEGFIDGVAMRLRERLGALRPEEEGE